MSLEVVINRRKYYSRTVDFKLTLKLEGEMGPLHSAVFKARSLGAVSQVGAHYEVALVARTPKALERKIARLESIMPRIVQEHPLVDLKTQSTE